MATMGQLMAMAERTFDLFKSLEGKTASINGATQIRAGVIRPEVICPLLDNVVQATGPKQAFELGVGTPIRVIREPYFGKLGTVTELPAQLMMFRSSQLTSAGKEPFSPCFGLTNAWRSGALRAYAA